MATRLHHDDMRNYFAIAAFASLCVGLGMIALTSGCAPYRVGADTLYPADVTSVHVPIFQSESFRRNLGERLTEAVCKRIEAEAVYKVTGSGSADSVLEGRIIEDRKRVLVENANDDAREIETSLFVQVTWKKRDGTILAQNNLPIDASITVDMNGIAPVVPEVGQSIATGHQKAIDRLAAQIVGLMEAPW